MELDNICKRPKINSHKFTRGLNCTSWSASNTDGDECFFLPAGMGQAYLKSLYFRTQNE